MNQKLKELQPYVISIRFPKGMPVVDTHFKTGWGLPNSKTIGKEPIPNEDNFFMLYPMNEKVGVDEILNYVETVIKLNVERENKYKLLNLKVKELEGLFSNASLSKCESLKFVFNDSVDTVETIKVTDFPLTMDEVEMVDPIEVKEPVRKPIKVNNEIIELPKKGEKIILEEFEPIKIICKCGPNDICPECADDKM